MQQSQPPESLRLDGIAHAYGSNRVLNGIDLTLSAGEVLALVGENGAGKSTLMKIVAGYLAPGEGQAMWQGQPVPATPQEAEAAGIVLVHQEFTLIPDLSVAENIPLGHEPTRLGLIDYAAMRATARGALRLLNSDIDPRAGMAGLPVSSWQIVELAKALAAHPRLLLMDEPTAVLGAREAEALFARIRAFAAEGGSVMNRVIKTIMNGDALIDADIFYPPTLIAPAIEVTAMRYATQSPIRGRYVLDSPLITKDNAEEFYFPDSPY